MKKRTWIIIIVFLFALQSHAQRKQFAYNPPPISRTDLMFYPGTSGINSTRVRIAAPNKTMIDIRLQTMRYLTGLRNLDSILAKVWEIVTPLKDSFPDDINNRLLNVNFDPYGPPKVRLVTYPPRGDIYVKTNDGLTRLKIEQDTLHITGFVPEERSIAMYSPGMRPVKKTGRNTIITYVPWHVMVLVNNLSELPALNNTNTYIKSILSDIERITPFRMNKTSYQPSVNLLYEPLSANTGLNKYVVYKQYRQKHVFTVLTQAGLQNVRTSIAPSVSVGAGFNSIAMERAGTAFYLAWEPYFFFDRNGAGKTVVQRNDFITFQFKNRFARIEKNVDFNLSNNFSLGYLVHREGDYFNKNTFKFGLPGLEFRNLQLQPQFIFNDLFKQFYPGIRLQVQIE